MKITLFIFLFSSFTLCHAQIVAGTYRFKSNDLSEGRSITFSDNKFNEEIVNDLNSKIGNGIYHIKNNQLILKYNVVLNQDSSSYELITSNKSNSSSIINLKVFDVDGNPLVGTYGCRDNKNKPLNFISTNDNGLGNITIYNNSSIGYFTIDHIGYHRISIPIKNLIGKIANITAYLRPQAKVYIEPQTLKYHISEISNKKLVLSENNITLVFEKID